MEINVEASLFPHDLPMGGSLRGRLPVIARLRFRLELTTRILGSIIGSKRLRLPGGDWADVVYYHLDGNRLVLEGELGSDTTRHLRTLKNRGWKLNPRASTYYGIKLPR
jgi:hypothetical protein